MRPGPICHTMKKRARRPAKSRKSLSTGSGGGSDYPEHQEREYHESNHGNPEEPVELADHSKNQHDDGKIAARDVLEHEVRPGSLHRCLPSTRELDLLCPGDEPERKPISKDRCRSQGKRSPRTVAPSHAQVGAHSNAGKDRHVHHV